MGIKTLSDLTLQNQRVLLRCDLNVPIKDGVITDDGRIVASLGTIRKLLDAKCSIIVVAHLGRPKGEASKNLSLAPIAKRLGEAIKVDDPAIEGNHLGPLVSDIQYGRVQAMIEKGIKEGATLLVGGLGRPEGFEKGYWVRPTIFADAHNKMAIAQEEIFGPVLTIIPFDSEEEAIEIANDTPYGLAGYVQSGDIKRAERIAKKLRVGMVHINGGGFNYGSPFGGYKQSGNGREGGIIGIEDFQEVKTLHYPE